MISGRTFLTLAKSHRLFAGGFVEQPVLGGEPTLEKFRNLLRGAIVAVTALLPAASFAASGTVTACTKDRFCYCIDKVLLPTIDQKVAMIRAFIADQKAHGKAVGYLSIPLSSVGGSYFGLNTEVAGKIKDRLEARLGKQAVWVLNPAGNDFVKPDEELLPKGSGADYMLMWTRVLEGLNGLGAFDFIYFVGPTDFASEFGFDGNADMAKVEAYYDNHVKTDDKLAKIDRRAFRDYYALRASVAFSYGSHDEWNIAQAINKRRRGADAKSGIARQMAIFFDGHPIAPGLFQIGIQRGDAGACHR
jgi:hypothetical protein